MINRSQETLPFLTRRDGFEERDTILFSIKNKLRGWLTWINNLARAMVIIRKELRVGKVTEEVSD